MNARHPNAPETLELRLPPHHIEAEQAVLGALMLDPEAYDRVADVLTDSDFYRDDHRRIFRHIGKLVNSAKPSDVVMVFEAIERSNEADQTGGLPYLAELANAVGSARNVRRYAEIVADRAMRRALLLAGDETAADALNAGEASAAERIDAALGRIMALAESRPSGTEPEWIQPAIASVIQEIEALQGSDGPVPGLATGFVELDRNTTGLHPGELVIIAGRPAMGKTALALNIAEHTALSGKVAAVFSMEMTKTELARRSLSSVGRINLTSLRTGKLTDDEWDRLTAAMGKLHEAPLVVDETGGLTLSQLRARARRIKRKSGRLDLVVIDYLQLMEGARGNDNRNDQITAITRGLKAMAKDLGCPVIALSQLSRKVEERTSRRPIMSDLRESGAIEQDADLILLMYREEYYKPDTTEKGIAEVIIGKQRNGPTGEVRLSFEGEFSRFGNLSFADVSRMSLREPGRKRGKGFTEQAE